MKPYTKDMEREDSALLFGEDQALIIDQGVHNIETQRSLGVSKVWCTGVVRKPSEWR